LICPLTDKLCTDPDCKQDGCIEQPEEEGEDVNA
jgi:hypothetical protein